MASPDSTSTHLPCAPSSQCSGTSNRGTPNQEGAIALNPRLYEVWGLFGGKSRFPCRGACITGPSIDCGHICCAWLFILVPSAFYFTYCAGFLWKEVHPILPILTAIILFTTLALLLLTSCTDPGIIPPHAVQMLMSGLADEVEAVTGMPRPVIDSASNKVKSPLTLEEERKTHRKWCTTCKILRPPGASHCSDCNCCVMTFDHHCPFVGNCVGERNYPFFISFLLSLLALAITVFSGASLYLSHDMGQQSVRLTPCTMIFLIIFGVLAASAFGVLLLASFHVYLTCSGRTTKEVLTCRKPARRAPTKFFQRPRSLLRPRSRISDPLPV